MGQRGLVRKPVLAVEAQCVPRTSNQPAAADLNFISEPLIGAIVFDRSDICNTGERRMKRILEHLCSLYKYCLFTYTNFRRMTKKVDENVRQLLVNANR